MTQGVVMQTKNVPVPVTKDVKQGPEAEVELYIFDFAGAKIYEKHVADHVNKNCF